jgi:cytochrome c oxidase cbb3-type subunit 3
MSDFVSDFWGVYIAVITVASIVACGVLLQAMSSRRVPGGSVETTGHVWDEDLRELNNPLPRWWMWLFWITIAFGIVYLVLYPGLGTFKGSLGWSSKGQYDEETKQAEAASAPIFNKYLAQDLKQLAADPQARAVGQKLFLNTCAPCHGSDARGGKGFPNLTDDDWLYGGDPETIKTTIMNGRNGVMPPLGAGIGAEGVRNVANYVRSLSGLPHDARLAELGKPTFLTICAACHGPEGKGNQQIGSPNLSDNIWLYGSDEKDIMATVNNGRGVNQLTPGQSAMPAHKDVLGEARVHLLAAYVWGLSNNAAAKGAAAPK